ncbi:MAG TPA: 5'/3'-nucleotidase SurE [Acidimicrobiales bacterium]|nr:5'/3'-nucleotidase SurE [Acidimicrobiales bacterium]
MRVLVTNDDGIDAPGLHALALALDEAGYDILVVAPDRNHSGYGAAIGDLGSGGSALELAPATVPGAEHLPAWGLVGPPALCVMAARLGGFGAPPDLVVAGVNPGNNTGRAVLHSGTVGAVLTGANLGVSGVAVSVAEDPEPHFAAAATVAVAAVGWVVTAPARTILNVNAPHAGLDDVRGVRWAELAPFGTVRATLDPVGDDRLEFGLAETAVELPADSDTALVNAGYVAVTTLSPIRAAEWEPVAAEVERRLAAGPAARRHRPPAGETA